MKYIDTGFRQLVTKQNILKAMFEIGSSKNKHTTDFYPVRAIVF